MTSNEPNPIEAVRARLDGGRKWWKGGMYGPDGRMCLVGAYGKITDRELCGLDVIGEVIREQYPDRDDVEEFAGTARWSVAPFNDHPDTTWADVDLVLDKASVRWDEAVR